MGEASIIQYIADAFEGVEIVTTDGNSFFFYDPEHKFPFATLVTNDLYDSASNLSRRSVFRLNIGIGKQTYQSLFGSQSSSSDAGDNASRDFTALDRLLPHPVYGQMYWVCILNPSSTTFETVVKPLLAEAYERDVRKHAKRATRG
jgi:hypothetical protein